MDRSPFLMIVEYLPKGDLRKYLLNAGEGGVTFEQLLSICGNVICSMINRTSVFIFIFIVFVLIIDCFGHAGAGGDGDNSQGSGSQVSYLF